MASEAPVMVLVAMTTEAAPLRGVPGLDVVRTGVGPERARDAARCMLGRRRPALLVSFGVAGALEPGLRAGSALLPSLVVAADGTRFPCAPRARARIADALAATAALGARRANGFASSDDTVGERPALAQGSLASVAEPVLTPSDRQRLAATTGAAAVDLESGALAAEAAEYGVPFIVARAVSDGLEDRVPAALLAALDADGRLSWARAATASIGRPRSLPALVRTAVGFRAACATLRRLAPALVHGPCRG